jgi:RNA polymerase sigma-70 factor (ECF subfamily)
VERNAALSRERTEPQLVKAAAAGDRDAFDLLVKRHFQPVFRLALRVLGNREDAEDLQQEAFVQAYRNLHRFHGDSALGTWLYSITVRLCLTRKRSKMMRQQEAVELVPSLDPSPNEDPETRLLALESAVRVQHTLLQLSPPDRLLVVLKYVEGLSHEEIARVFGCSAASSRSRLARAKRLFRESYERRE